jgi:hypothetical protein
MWTLKDFLNSSAGREMRWYADRDTNEVVGFCPFCKAELRFSIDGPSERRFAHKDSCSHSDEKRAQRLVDGMATVLDDETDAGVRLSSVEVLAAVVCVMAANDTGMTLDSVTESFVSAVEQRLRDKGRQMQMILSAPERAA